MDSDKRKFLRFLVTLPVQISAVTGEKWATTRDFSREGMGIVAEKFDAREGEELSLKVQLPETERFTEVKGKVCWRQHQGDNWLAGIKLEDIDKADKADILDYAYQRWRSMMSTNYGKNFS